MRKLFNNRMVVVFVLLLLAFFPTSLSRKSMSNNNAIVIAVGMDKKDEKYTLSFQVVIPKQDNSYRESLIVLSSSGKNLYEVYRQAETQIGKRIAYRHCQYIVVNEEMAKTEDMTIMFDYLIRNRDISNSCILLCTDKSANDIMVTDSKTESQINMGIIELLEFYEKKYYVYDTNLENFVKGCYSPRKCSLMTFISISEDINKGIGSSSEGGGGSGGSSSEDGGTSSSGSSSQEGKKNKYLSFEGDVVVFRDAKYASILSSDELLALNWFNGSSGYSDKFIVENVSDEVYDDATIGLELIDKKTTIKAYFENGVPILAVNINCKMTIESVKNATQSKVMLQSGKFTLTKTLESKIQQMIYNGSKDVFEKMIELKTDIIDVYSKFNKYHHKEFTQLLNGLNSDEFYLQKVKLVINSTIKT